MPNLQPVLVLWEDRYFEPTHKLLIRVIARRHQLTPQELWPVVLGGSVEGDSKFAAFLKGPKWPKHRQNGLNNAERPNRFTSVLCVIDADKRAENREKQQANPKPRKRKEPLSQVLAELRAKWQEDLDLEYATDVPQNIRAGTILGELLVWNFESLVLGAIPPEYPRGEQSVALKEVDDSTRKSASSVNTSSVNTSSVVKADFWEKCPQGRPTPGQSYAELFRRPRKCLEATGIMKGDQNATEEILKTIKGHEAIDGFLTRCPEFGQLADRVAELLGLPAPPDAAKCPPGKPR